MEREKEREVEGEREGERTPTSIPSTNYHRWSTSSSNNEE